VNTRTAGLVDRVAGQDCRAGEVTSVWRMLKMQPGGHGWPVFQEPTQTVAGRANASDGTWSRELERLLLMRYCCIVEATIICCVSVGGKVLWSAKGMAERFRGVYWSCSTVANVSYRQQRFYSVGLENRQRQFASIGRNPESRRGSVSGRRLIRLYTVFRGRVAYEPLGAILRGSGSPALSAGKIRVGGAHRQGSQICGDGWPRSIAIRY